MRNRGSKERGMDSKRFCQGERWMEGIMGVLSSFRQLDENSVKIWNSLPEEKFGGDGEVWLEIEGFQR
ncbi:hypothetical protein Pyn_19608 [Prunus yedoensis var. nudiflora]|uniref:Uncharacterized protein n=1 Tax=Prunus yedoensis var. nudiflora TaxID=2094558 RepID=A0A314V2S8_PRUYE|nr:hypothetical protein Pyn_19608 [Prunus yedoensis var. nudiflora]